MPTNLLIQVPDVLLPFRPLLLDFFRSMIVKLEMNAHKSTPTRESLPQIMKLLLGEINEFIEQIEIDKFDANSLMELADQANFAFLAYVALKGQEADYVDRIRRQAINSKTMANPPDGE